mmetsp:Transcript_37356/g.114654  ORF Transcript_37356/g.114654 Transcript_37356/m.114654 type:complete len:816 (-) Transcript_37356:88-2535(-)
MQLESRQRLARLQRRLLGVEVEPCNRPARDLHVHLEIFELLLRLRLRLLVAEDERGRPDVAARRGGEVELAAELQVLKRHASRLAPGAQRGLAVLRVQLQLSAAAHLQMHADVARIEIEPLAGRVEGLEAQPRQRVTQPHLLDPPVQEEPLRPLSRVHGDVELEFEVALALARAAKGASVAASLERGAAAVVRVRAREPVLAAGRRLCDLTNLPPVHLEGELASQAAGHRLLGVLAVEHLHNEEARPLGAGGVLKRNGLADVDDGVRVRGDGVALDAQLGRQVLLRRRDVPLPVPLRDLIAKAREGKQLGLLGHAGVRPPPEAHKAACRLAAGLGHVGVAQRGAGVERAVELEVAHLGELLLLADGDLDEQALRRVGVLGLEALLVAKRRHKVLATDPHVVRRRLEGAPRGIDAAAGEVGPLGHEDDVLVDLGAALVQPGAHLSCEGHHLLLLLLRRVELLLLPHAGDLPGRVASPRPVAWRAKAWGRERRRAGRAAAALLLRPRVPLAEEVLHEAVHRRIVQQRVLVRIDGEVAVEVEGPGEALPHGLRQVLREAAPEQLLRARELGELERLRALLGEQPPVPPNLEAAGLGDRRHRLAAVDRREVLEDEPPRAPLAVRLAGAREDLGHRRARGVGGARRSAVAACSLWEQLLEMLVADLAREDNLRAAEVVDLAVAKDLVVELDAPRAELDARPNRLPGKALHLRQSARRRAGVVADEAGEVLVAHLVGEAALLREHRLDLAQGVALDAAHLEARRLVAPSLAAHQRAHLRVRLPRRDGLLPLALAVALLSRLHHLRDRHRQLRPTAALHPRH